MNAFQHHKQVNGLQFFYVHIKVFLTEFLTIRKLIFSSMNAVLRVQITKRFTIKVHHRPTHGFQHRKKQCNNTEKS